MVARLLREQEVVGSSPVASTTLPNKPFLLVWLFCCVRLTKKPNVALGAVWQTSFYGMLNFVTLRELSSLAAPSLPLLASPVASTNVETRLFCKESAFLRTLFAFCRFLLLPESSLSGFLFFSSPFACLAFLLRSHLKQAKSALEKAKKSLYPKCTPKKI